MFLIDVLLVLAMLFFLFLPVTARRTVHMKLALICTLLALLCGAAARSRVEVEHRRIEIFRFAATVQARAAVYQRPAFDQQGVATIGELDAPRSAVAILLRHTMGPLLGR